MSLAMDSGVGETAVYRVLTRHTGYSSEELSRDFLLEDDLGIDSVLLEAVLIEIERDAVGAHLRRDVKTVGDILEEVQTIDVVEPAACVDPDEVAGQAALEDDLRLDHADLTEEAEKLSTAVTMKDFGPDGAHDLFAKAARFAEHRRTMEEQQLYWYGMPSSGRLRGRGIYHDMQAGCDREYLLFSSNNYLGLANDPRVSEPSLRRQASMERQTRGAASSGAPQSFISNLSADLPNSRGAKPALSFPEVMRQIWGRSQL